ncbi:hypothetical protein [Aquariibacter albus]|uniref:Uncharacterized protein n=1 Tax=Aquariibacter albus TaxID=2759899 RepID=A0A839HTI8_9BURK|nr:hypothetical protein [Aquariibacter albus]MBB1162581.1 hypothetical protein [Aquariibacter albus]
MTDLTRELGLLAFGLGALACATAARAVRAHRGPARLWLTLAALHALLLLDTASNARHLLRALVIAGLKREDLYAGRGPWQLLLLAALGLGLLAVGRGGLRRLGRRGGHRAPDPVDPADPRRPLRLAWLAAVALGLILGLELVSLHAVDAWLYAPVGPVRRIALLWAACGLLTGTAAGIALRAARSAA